MNYSWTEKLINMSVPVRNTICIGRQMAYATVNFNRDLVLMGIDWFWMKSAGSQLVHAPSFPQNILTENVTKNIPVVPVRWVN